jgi:hypothetical protein
MPDGPGMSLPCGLCLVPPVEFPNKLLEYRDDCNSANDVVELTDDVIIFDDDIEFCSNDEPNVILRPAILLYIN